MAKTVHVDIDEQGNVSVDIIGGTDSSCHDVTEAFKKLGKVVKDVKKPEYYRQPNRTNIQSGR